MKNRLLWVILGIPVVLYCFVLVRSLIPAAVHDQNLRLERASIPAGSNAFDVLQGAGRHLWSPDKLAQQLSDLASDTNWDDSEAGTILASNREALAAWDSAAQLPEFQVPPITNFDDSLSYLMVWKKLAVVAEVRANLLMHQGRDQEAFDQMVSQVQLGRRMENARGPLICYLVGVAVDSLALSRMQHWAGQTHLDAGQLKAYARQLALDPGAEGEAFANAVRAEYQSQVGTLRALRNGEVKNTETGVNYPRLGHWAPVFNLSQTKALFANMSLRLVTNASNHYNIVKWPDLEAGRPGVVSLILSGNAAGRIMYYLMTPAIIQLEVKKSQADTQLQATRTILALRAYQLTHGHLPPDLAALVPEFLDKVPVDDFDGQPLRYLPDRKMVYSVGQNLKDDGGNGARSGTSYRPLDLVYPFDF